MLWIVGSVTIPAEIRDLTIRSLHPDLHSRSMFRNLRRLGWWPMVLGCSSLGLLWLPAVSLVGLCVYFMVRAWVM